MTGQRQAAYLEAMGISVWKPRVVSARQPVAANLAEADMQVTLADNTDNDSSWLWMVADGTQTEHQLLADIRRAVGDDTAGNICYPVEFEGQSLGALIKDRLMTRVVLFGEDLDAGQELAAKNIDVIRTASLQLLMDSAGLKQELWQKLRGLAGYQTQ
jgi:DNA polymerase III psi subunit